MGRGSQVTARIVVGGVEHPVGPDRSATFGRSRECEICLDPEDAAISRVAGELEFEHGTWWLTNRSATRPLSIVDDLGLRSVLPPGRRTAVEGPTRVLVDGVRGQHSLLVEVPALTPAADLAATGPVDTGTPTATGAEVLITEADRMAMIALFAGYLADPPRYDPNPKSYAAAAARLGWPRTTLVKRIEYLRTRLDAAGVPNMMGFNALANLAEYAISRRLITRDDLALLRRS
jgi:hypothetical protein